jgi:hypothetical protein
VREGRIMAMEEKVKFVPFDLVSQKKINKVVDVRDGGGKNGKKMTARVKVRNAAAGRGGNLGPTVDVFVSSLFKNSWVLADDDFLGEINGFGETKNGVNKGGGVEFLAIST